VNAGDDAPRRGRIARFGGRSRKRYDPKEVGLAALFLAPSLVVFAVFFYYPFFRLLGWGTYKSQRGGASYRSVGGAQYRDLLWHDVGHALSQWIRRPWDVNAFSGGPFPDGLAHSVQYVLLTVPAGLVLGVLLAVAAHRRLKGIKVFQAIFSSTLASSVAVSSVIFFFLINPTVGIFRYNWRNEKGMALFNAALPSIWQNLGLAFVIVLAGLQAVPDELYEAATLDGYGPIRRLTRITLPLISPVLMFLLVVLVIFGFQAFAQIEVITNGGPAGASETLVFKIFRQNQNYGAGAVMSMGLFAVTLVVTSLQFAILERRVHYGN
jgi:sn-glycerol 3-phosphate transport system permease protein